jgi:hypothetical protein
MITITSQMVAEIKKTANILFTSNRLYFCPRRDAYIAVGADGIQTEIPFDSFDAWFGFLFQDECIVWQESNPESKEVEFTFKGLWTIYCISQGIGLDKPILFSQGHH